MLPMPVSTPGNIGTGTPKIHLIRWAVFIVVLLAIIGIFSFWFGRASFSEARLKLEIEAPEEITSGQEVTYKLKIENKNEITLLEPKISFFYPSDSVVLDERGNLKDAFVTSVALEPIKKGEVSEKEFKAFVIGDRGNIKSAKAVLAYRPENIKSVFEKETTAATTISRVSIYLSLAVPPNVISGQNIDITLDYRNESQEDINNLRIKFDFPKGLALSKFNPQPTIYPNIWEIPLLKQTSGSRVSIAGAISGQEKETKAVSAVLQKKINNRWIDFQKVSSQMIVAKPFLDIGLTVNESSEYIANLGDELDYKIVFKNSSKNNFKALTLRAFLEGSMFDFGSVKANGFFDQGSRVILWNEAVEPKLGNLGPSSEGEVSFKIKLKPNITSTPFSAKDFSVKVSASIETSQVPANFELDKVSAQKELITKIATQAAFKSLAFHNDPSWNINSGIAPPQVGSKTTYTVHWQVGSASSDLSNVRIKSFLPPGVMWENKVKVNFSQTQPEYNPATGEVVWIIPNIPSGTGVKTPNFEAIFQISITPSEPQIGQEPVLLKEAVLSGVDVFTKKSVNVTTPQITTGNIEDSPGAVQSAPSGEGY